MIVTEEEAKQKRCQETFGDRIVGYGDIAEIKPDADPLSQGGIAAMHYTSPVYCIGSACMAWRWQLVSTFIPMPADKLVERMEFSTTHGYCGKAGKP